jgi:hypothetical protein
MEMKSRLVVSKDWGFRGRRKVDVVHKREI